MWPLELGLGTLSIHALLRGPLSWVGFPVWLGIPKPMIPYPLLWEGAVRTVGSHLGRIPNCSQVPDPPPPPRPPPGIRPPRWPPRRPSQNLPSNPPPPPPRGLRPTVSWGGKWRPKPRGCPPPPRGHQRRQKFLSGPQSLPKRITSKRGC